MENKNEIEVLIKVPSDFLTNKELDIFSTFSRGLRDSVEELVRKEAVKKIMENIEIPEIEVSSKEVKDRVLTILAERVLENMDENKEYEN